MLELIETSKLNKQSYSWNFNTSAMLTVKISEFITKRILYYLINSVYKQGIQNSFSSRRINKTKSDVNRDFTSG